MNILVIGCCRLGASLACRLDEQGHDVVVIDEDENLFVRLGENFSGITFAGSPMNASVLRNAGAASCDAIAVVTGDDNLNITVSQMAKGFFHVDRVVARIADPAREEVFSALGLNCICHTNLACDAMYAALTENETDQTLRFAKHAVKFSRYPARGDMIDHNLSLLSLPKGEYPFALERKDGTLELYHEPCRILVQPGDTIVTVHLG